MADAQEAVEFLREANDAESENRQLALTDLKFRYGEQWPEYAMASRGLDRPQLTLNEMDSYIRQVTNGQRQQRPRIKVDPVDSYADPKIAKVITGLTRHIEVNSDADNAYDTAFDFAATTGLGYWRIRTDYVAEDSFNQDIWIDSVDNPFTVYFDPNSRLPDGSDAEKALVTDLMRKSVFAKEYPGANLTGFQDRGTGDSDPDWMTQHDVRIAEYFNVERVKCKLVMLQDGTTLWADEVPRLQAMLLRAGIGIHGERESFKRTVHWQKQTSDEVLEEKTLPGRWIPIVPVYWTAVKIDSQRVIQGLVRPGMDAQRMINFWQTSMTEAIALAPKAKWLMAEGADEGHENEYKNANLSPNPVLRFKTTGVDGQPIPPPERIQPEPPPSGIIEAGMTSNQVLQRIMGIFDPAVQSKAPKSGKAVIAERAQSENSNYHGYDNLTRSIKHTGRIILSYIPTIYDTQRVQRIIGEDGTAELVTLNEKSQAQGDSGEIIQRVLNDVTVGTYDVVMDTGPGYDTKRIEGVESMLQLMATPLGEEVAKIGGDIMVRSMDFHGADLLADRMEAANPMAQIDENLDIPPKIQMMIKQLQAQLQQGQQINQELAQELKFRVGLENVKQAGETKRELLRVTGKAHDVEMNDATKRHDVESRAITAQNVAEINGIVQLLVKHIDTAQLEREIAARNSEQQTKAAETV